MTAGGRALLVVALVVLATVPAVGSVAGGAGGEAVAQQQTTTTTNSTQHENPDEADEDGNLADLSGWLVQRLAQRLGNSTVQLSQSQYEFADELVGEQFEQRLEQFVEVAGETESSTDNQAAQTIRETQSAQQQYIEALQRYNRTLADYRAAIAAGNTDRARALARELRALEERLQRLSETLVANYANLSELTDVSLIEEANRIEDITENVTETVSDIQERLFTDTRLTITSGGGPVSFLDPLRISGRLETVNGTAISGRQIILNIGHRRITTTTDESGSFSVSYRPTRLSLTAEHVTVRYVPANASTYLGSNASVPVSVSAVTPTITLNPITDTLGYGDQVTVSGRVSVDDIGAGGVPVRITLGGTILGVVQTDSEGYYRLNTTLPAGIAAGQATLTVRTITNGTALAPVERNRQVRITETATRLMVQTTANGSRVGVQGRLETVDGRALADRMVTIQVGDRTVRVRTGPEGSFATTVRALERVPSGEQTVTVVVSYDGTGTNLGSATVRRQVVLGEDVGLLGRLIGGLEDLVAALRSGSPLLVGGVAGLALLFVAALVVMIRRDRSEGTQVVDEPTTAETSSSSRQFDAQTMLERAASALDAGNSDGAVRRAYAGVRRALTPSDRPEGALTHWELLRAHRDRTDDVAGLERLTAAYERAAYAEEPVSPEEARDALDAAEDVLHDGEPRSG